MHITLENVQKNCTKRPSSRKNTKCIGYQSRTRFLASILHSIEAYILRSQTHCTIHVRAVAFPTLPFLPSSSLLASTPAKKSLLAM